MFPSLNTDGVVRRMCSLCPDETFPVSINFNCTFADVGKPPSFKLQLQNSSLPHGNVGSCKC